MILVLQDEDKTEEQAFVKIKDKYFEVYRIFGQGLWTFVSLLEKEPDYAFVKIPEEL